MCELVVQRGVWLTFNKLCSLSTVDIVELDIPLHAHSAKDDLAAIVVECHCKHCIALVAIAVFLLLLQRFADLDVVHELPLIDIDNAQKARVSDGQMPHVT